MLRLRALICRIVLSIALSVSFAIYASPLQFINQFDGNATGVLTSVVVTDNDSIWVGGENGLFGIVGKQSSHFCDKKSSLNKNYVSAIAQLDKDKLLIAVYGGGLYVFDTIEHSFEKIQHALNHDLDAVWKLAISEAYIVVSSISNVYLLNTHTLKVEADFRELGINVGNRVFNVAFHADTETVWWTDEKRGVFSYSLRNENWISYLSNENFLNSKNVSALHVEKEKAYVGTEIGLFEVDISSGFTAMISERPPVIYEKYNPIKSIKRSPTGVLWVAAERLYTVNFEEGKFESAPQLHPFLARDELDTVLDIEFDTLGNLIAIDTSKGLVVIPPQSIAVSYLNDNLDIFDKHISSARFVSENQLAFLSEGQLGIYDVINNRIDFKILPTSEELFIGNISDNTVELVGRTGSHLSVEISTSDVKTFENVLLHKSSTILELEVNTAGQLVFIEEGEERDYLIGERDGSLKKLLSNAFSTLFVSDADTVLAAASGEGIFEISDKNGIKKVGKDSNFELSSVVFLFEDHDGEIWACTSGEGVYKLEIGSTKFNRVNSIPANYIRAIAAINQQWLLVTTNIGLFLYDKVDNQSFQIGNEFGIPDTDFAYKGIYTSDTHTLIAGDNLNYIIDNQKLIQSIEHASQIKHHAVITSFGAFDEEKNVVIPTGKRFHEALKSGNPLELKNDEFMFEVEVTAANFMERERLQVEYRLIGLKEQWTRASDSTAKIVFSSLPFGHYIFEARVVDPRSDAIQPVSSLKLRVLPPLWLSLEAVILYLAILCVLAFVLFRRYQQKIALRGTELSGMVDEKQTALADSSLSIRKLLERKQVMFTNISHELRTPLALVLGPLKQIKSRPNDAENPQRIDLALDNVGKLEKLVDHLLEIEQVESLCENDCKSYDIKTDLSKIVASVQPLADLKEQEFISVIRGRGQITLTADSLEKICHNLISNAVKYTDNKGRVKVEASCQELHLVIKVSDSGRGIPEEQITQIFHRFARAENDTAETGTGVGLALVKELVLINQGWIDVASKEGKGSTFTVYLPLIDTSLLLSTGISQQAQSPIVNALPEPNGIAKNKPIILLVEDNEDMRAYLYSLLKHRFTCLLARHGMDAMNIVKTIDPDLVITDYMMPVMDGISLAAKLRKREHISHIPIILLTARGDSETQARSLATHIDHCLTKPIADDELLLRIETLLALRERCVEAIPHLTEPDNFQDESIDIPTYECEKDQAFYVKFIAIVEKYYQEETFNRAQAASELAVSERQLNRKLAALLEYNFTEYLKNYRLNKSKALLRSGEQVTQIALEVGFNSTSYFSSRFKEKYGMSPSQYQDSYAEEKKRA
ncbi:ATP-binding protein [Alteromonas ponticola]|uniref:histidine kinase n=1 Tax=Alteromonas ponticola TaxID=2720613 RepID=A0ABX1R6N0_9ALTE|nr:ATP-binding protein [Alteromonas ponticola]NMH60883.1 response regulator [Alteromonas ponticola]